MTSLHSPKVVTAILVAVCVLSLIVMVESDAGSNTAMISGTVALIIPYLVPFAWLGSAGSRAKYFDPVWIKVALAFGSVAYLAVSTSWASAVLNEAFNVPASNFPITLVAVTLLYLPTQLVFLLLLSIVLVSAFANLAVLWAVFLSKNWRALLKRVGFLFGVVIYLVFLHGTSGFFAKNMIYLSQLIAVRADFDENHRCTNLNNPSVTKVSHVGNGNVITFNPNRTGAQSFNDLFEFAKCEFWPET